MSTTIIVPKKRGASQGRLNQQQRQFVHELLADASFCGAAAARRAGYRNPGQVANKLLKHPVIAVILGKAMREREERLQITADQVLFELVRIAFYNGQDYVDESGEEIPILQLTREKAAVKGTSIAEKLKALEMLAKHFSILNDKVQHEVVGGVQLDFVSLVKQLEARRSNVIDAEMIERIASAQ